MTTAASAKKKTGRPRVDSEAVNVRLERATLDRLDAWIAQLPDPPPSRPEAIRRILSQALAHLSGDPAPAPRDAIDAPAAANTYHATRLSGQSPVDEWRGEAPDDESAVHRLAQHLKTKLEQNTPGYSPDESVTLTRPEGEIVTMARASEFIKRLSGWNTSPSANHDLDADDE